MSQQSAQTIEAMESSANGSSSRDRFDVAPLVREIQDAAGFKLLLVNGPSPGLAGEYLADLRRQLPQKNLQHLRVEKPITNLLDELIQYSAQPGPDAVFVSGLEHSLPMSPE